MNLIENETIYYEDQITEVSYYMLYLSNIGVCVEIGHPLFPSVQHFRIPGTATLQRLPVSDIFPTTFCHILNDHTSTEVSNFKISSATKVSNFKLLKIY